MAGFAFVAFHQAAVGGGAKGDDADAELVDIEEIGDQFGAADVAEVAVGQDESREVVHALSAEVGFQEEFDRVGVAAIDEERWAGCGGSGIDGVAARERDDGEVGGGAVCGPMPGARTAEEQGEGAGGGKENLLSAGFEPDKVRQSEPEEEGAIIESQEERPRFLDVVIGERQGGGPLGPADHAMHPPPGAVVEEFGCSRVPGAAEQAGQV